MMSSYVSKETFSPSKICEALFFSLPYLSMFFIKEKSVGCFFHDCTLAYFQCKYYDGQLDSLHLHGRERNEERSGWVFHDAPAAAGEEVLCAPLLAKQRATHRTIAHVLLVARKERAKSLNLLSFVGKLARQYSRQAQSNMPPPKMEMVGWC